MTALKEGGTLTDNPMDVCVGGCLLGSVHNFSGNSYLKVLINPSLTREIGASSKTVFISFHSVSRQETIVVSRYIRLYAEVSSRSALNSERISNKHLLRTFAPKNFPRTDIFKTLTAGRK